jgi:hypothetical protein
MSTATWREPLATPAEAAAYLRRSPKTLRNWRAKGEGPRFTGRGPGVRYRWPDVEKWLREQQT